MAEDTLSKLWKQAVGGDEEAESAIFRHLTERFTFLAGLSMCKEDARDLAHDACLIVLKGYKNLGSPYEYGAWAQKVLRSKIADYFQRKSRDRKVFVGIDAYEADLACPKNNLDYETLETLRRCLEKLATAFPRYADAIHLKHVGYDTDGICGKMKVTKSNLYVLLSRARVFLKDCILDGGGIQ